MRNIDKLLEKIKKEVKEKGRKLIIPALLTTTLITSEARAEEKKSFSKSLLDRISIEASYSYGKPELNKEFLKQYSDSFATPYFKQYLEQPWQDFEQAKNLQMIGGKINFELYKNKEKKLSIDVNVGIEKGKTNADYNKTYTSNEPYYGKVLTDVIRNEKTTISKPSIGAKVTKKLSDKISVSGSLSADFYNVDGNANITFARSFPNTSSPFYTQWRNASCSGKATGFSGEVDLTYELGKNVSVSVGGGLRSGKVSTSGREIKTASTNPGMSWEYDYSPTFNLNGVYGKAVFRLRF
jgi:hypothetical protein